MNSSAGSTSSSNGQATAKTSVENGRLRGVRVGYLSAAMQTHHTYGHLKATVDSVRAMVADDSAFGPMYEEAKQGAATRGVEAPNLSDVAALAKSDPEKPIPKAKAATE